MANTHRTPEQWLKIFEQHALSGLQIVAFCKQQKLNTSSFYAWRKRLALTNERLSLGITKNLAPTPKDNKVDDWVNIMPPETLATQHWDIELALPNGVTLRMMNR